MTEGDTLLTQDLRALGRQGSPDDFVDICFELEHELERFREFCAFPNLANKFVVAFGGAFSAGKSSLINALLGKRLLVTEVDPTTSLPTYLLHGDQQAIHAQNLFNHSITLTEEEFLSLTHDEFMRYGSNISRLLHSAFISSPDFQWPDLAIIDTPGYTKHEDPQYGARTDKHLARTQLNSAQGIVWVIDARQGCITEDDLNFLSALPADIPRLFVLSRADQKPVEDIDSIIALIRNTLETRNVPFIDIVPVSARTKQWPLTRVHEQFSQWNNTRHNVRFAHNFKRQFMRYQRHIENERRKAQQHLNRLNRIQALTEEGPVQKDTRELKLHAIFLLKETERLQEELISLRNRFFSTLKIIGDHISIPFTEPSELDNPDNESFDLLLSWQRQLEALGRQPLAIPFTLHELTAPGATPKIDELLNGQASLEPNSHFASNLDDHSRETYLRVLITIVCQGQLTLTNTQSGLLLQLLQSLGMKDIRGSLLAQARATTKEDLKEYHRIISEHKLETNLFFDALMLSRSGGPLNTAKEQTLATLGEILELDEETTNGMPILAGYVLGLHSRSEYTDPEIINLKAWHALFFHVMDKSDISDGEISGYYRLVKNTSCRKRKIEEIKISNALIFFDGFRIDYPEANIAKTTINNSSLIGPDLHRSSNLEITRSDIIFHKESKPNLRWIIPYSRSLRPAFAIKHSQSKQNESENIIKKIIKIKKTNEEKLNKKKLNKKYNYIISRYNEPINISNTDHFY